MPDMSGQPTQPSTVVLVAGAGWGGSLWEPVAERLGKAGHTVLAPTLTGLGELAALASPEVDLDTHVDDVVRALTERGLADVVLVGHSYAGMVITGVAELVPERLRRLVYVDALVPLDGEADVDILDQHLVDDILAARDRGEWLIPLAPDAPAGMAPHPIATVTQPVRVRSAAAARVPRTYVRCTHSRLSFTRLCAERAVAAGWRCVELDSGHLPMTTSPDDLAALLVDEAAAGT